MNKCSTAFNGNVNVALAFDNSARMREKVSNVARCRTTLKQDPRERPNSTVLTSEESLRSQQRRWSVDFCKCQTPPVILVRKNKKEPDPPQRSASLLKLQTSIKSFKRYSCPPIGNFSSTSSSSSSSCCSPTSVPTSVIIGTDPLGWKIQSKSRSDSSQVRAKRLSLQIPLPAIPTPSSPNPKPSFQTKPAVGPKPSRGHHSESSAFLRSPGKTLPVVTLDQLHAVHLRPVGVSDELDDVFDEPTQGQDMVTSLPPKIPPSIPEKTDMARKIAQVIACSRKTCQVGTAKIAAKRPMSKHHHQNMGHSSVRETKMAELHLENVCNRIR